VCTEACATEGTVGCNQLREQLHAWSAICRSYQAYHEHGRTATCSLPVFGGSSVALLPASPLLVLGSASAGCRLASLLFVALASCIGAHVEQQYSLHTPAATMLKSYVIGGQSERQCWYYASLEAVCIVQGACNKQQ
jgi:hypothetical protein